MGYYWSAQRLLHGQEIIYKFGFIIFKKYGVNTNIIHRGFSSIYNKTMATKKHLGYNCFCIFWENPCCVWCCNNNISIYLLFHVLIFIFLLDFFLYLWCRMILWIFAFRLSFTFSIQSIYGYSMRDIYRILSVFFNKIFIQVVC